MARVFVGMFAFLVLTATPAEAGDLWAWIKELSGPGPFHGSQLDVRLACVGSVKSAADYAESIRAMATADKRDGKQVAPVAAVTAVADEFARVSLPPSDTAEQLATSVRTANSPLADELTAYARAARAKDGVDLPASGVFYSACRGIRANAPIALGATFRSVHNSPTGPADYAGGNQINLTTMGATVTWRPFNSFKNDRIDVVDIGMAVSGYSFTSHGTRPGGFAPLSGIMLEPLRLEFHFPSSIRNSDTWWWLSVPFVQFSWVIFPSGFEPTAFGPDLVGEKAQRLPAEWVRAGNFFFDFTPIAHRIARHFK